MVFLPKTVNQPLPQKTAAAGDEDIDDALLSQRNESRAVAQQRWPGAKLEARTCYGCSCLPLPMPIEVQPV